MEAHVCHGGDHAAFCYLLLGEFLLVSLLRIGWVAALASLLSLEFLFWPRFSHMGLLFIHVLRTPTLNFLVLDAAQNQSGVITGVHQTQEPTVARVQGSQIQGAGGAHDHDLL